MIDSKDFVKIMDIPFLNKTKKDALNHYIFPRLNKQQKCFIVTGNPEIVMKTREDPTYKQIVLSADYVIPDGAGILLAAKHINEPIPERVSGLDVMMDLLSFAEVQGLRCFFLGAKDYVNEKAVLEAERKYPNLKIAGHHHGYFELEDPAIVKKVKDSNPDIIFVALGLPRQEEWISKHIDEFSKGLFMGVGGSFDVLAGNVKRAPDWIIKLNLEWLYRLIKQPYRFKRIIKVFEFIFRFYLKK
jgi:N-acetylglucosaminyldiphosphoundecaprenol N-acetyl-beta-D-mannosaminyltransferase